MLETTITMCCLFVILAYVMTRKLGLLDAVPRDPQARVASYTSSVLSLLKEQLVHSRLEKWEAGRVTYVKGKAEASIWVEDGNVHFQQGEQQSTLPLGDKGKLTFELVGSALSVTIVAAESSGAEHSTEVSLPLAS